MIPASYLFNNSYDRASWLKQFEPAEEADIVVPPTARHTTVMRVRHLLQRLRHRAGPATTYDTCTTA